MISVEIECDYIGCNGYEGERIPGPGEPAWAAEESVDVYLNDWTAGAPLSGYLPEGWEVSPRTYDGLLAVYCPQHAHFLSIKAARHNEETQ